MTNRPYIGISTTISNNSQLKNNWEIFKERMRQIDDSYIGQLYQTQAYLSERSEKYGGNKRFSHGNFIREVSDKARDLAFYHRISGDRESGAYVKKMIALVCSEEQWVFQQRGTEKKSGLWSADIGGNITIAFEMVSEEMTSAECDVVRDSLYHKAFTPIYDEWVNPSTHVHALDTMGHNWWSVCVSGAGIVLLVLGDRVKGYGDYLESIVEGLLQWFKYPGNVLQNKKANFGPDGDYLEYTGYLDYALRSFIVFEAYYRKKKKSLLLNLLSYITEHKTIPFPRLTHIFGSEVTRI